ncbi:protein EDS1B-like [Euphorbia lathyris]|uniref:protein EDS1B-like n=1 Tax=Euphorbia lathyris TaxID=212925 RepID=UPI00331367DE
MEGVRLGDCIGIREDVINKVCSIAIKAHKASGKQLYLSEKIRSSSQVVFSFPGSWSVTDWYSNTPFGEVKVDNQLFPSLKYIGLDETASVNEAFQHRFKQLWLNQHFRKEVGAAAADKKQVIFTGHCLGAPVAILAAIWFLEEYIRPDPNKTVAPLCLTFGSPFVGDHIISHSLRRENWSDCFINFVMGHDIVPRISLTPLSAIQHQLQQILSLFSPKPPREPLGEALIHFFITVLRNVSSVASHAACKIMGSTNLLLETVSNFIELSPYRPLGTFVFCTGNGKLVVVKNSDAILQLLFYTSQLNSEAELTAVAQSSITSHLNYQSELLESLEMQCVTFLDDHHLEALPLASDVDAEGNTALNELGLSARARLCLRAAGDLEKQKRNNQTAINLKLAEIENELRKLQGYQKKCQHKVGYYDAFKISEDREDFDANVTRLKLAGIWDEIIEMLKRYQLPDGYEGQKAWIDIGTRYRRVVEPLDIANYYRHLKNEDTGPYMDKGRPKRYKCTQRWLEHAERMTDPALESCFWAEVEELCVKSGGFGVREHACRLKSKAEEWIRNGWLDQDVFSKGSTFDKLLKEHFLTLEQPVAYQGMWK